MTEIPLSDALHSMVCSPARVLAAQALAKRRAKWEAWRQKECGPDFGVRMILIPVDVKMPPNPTTDQVLDRAAQEWAVNWAFLPDGRIRFWCEM